MAHLSHLLSPGRIGPIATRNRIVMAPMGTNLAEADGHAGERIVRYYEARARGGAGLIVVGVGAVAYPAGACIPNQIAISDDAFIPGLRNLTDRIHAHGARVALQLQHAGKVATQDIAAGRPLWVPSEIPLEPGDLVNDLATDEVQAMTSYFAQPGARLAFHALTISEIGEVIRLFADAAERAAAAGFDGVEIHAAHGYLISAFLSPAWNRRTDAYGGSLDNRARLLIEVIRAVRERVGTRLAVWCRLDAREVRIAGGITLDDALQTAEWAVDAGLDAVHVSAYGNPTSAIAFTEAPLVHRPCGLADLARAVKERIAAPVIAVGRIAPGEADALIAAGHADFVAMGRKLLADPDLPRKLAEGAEVRPCIYSYACVSRIFLNQRVACAVNPSTGREAEATPPRTAPRRRILIAGGGPAGLEAARRLAELGHDVTLCERSERLGGLFALAALTYAPNAEFLAHLEGQVASLPVEVRTRCEVTPALVAALRPDMIVIATGARWRRPVLPGIDRANVLDLDVLSRMPPGAGLGERVVVLGAGPAGLALADHLGRQGKDVAVVEEASTLGVPMPLPRRWRTLHELRERGTRLFSGARVEAVGVEGVRVCHDGRVQVLAADTVVIASGAEANSALAEELAGCGVPLHPIGDCRGAGYIEGAMRDAAELAAAAGQAGAA